MSIFASPDMRLISALLPATTCMPLYAGLDPKEVKIVNVP
jgi:hypothetical protein